MTSRTSRWLVPVFGLILALLVVGAELGADASPTQAAIAFAIVAAYALGIGLLQYRSETASLLAGLPVDERWGSINQRALSLAAQVMAVALAVVFISVSFAGGDAIPYALLGALFAASYLGGILWYRWRS
jgi:uncharacterized membrane protein